ncbi:MAG: hypothetical protein HY314_01890 [Acidobacteria bacterium]|nr:hypothetical protein [Acidobacteriota bacterium]
MKRAIELTRLCRPLRGLANMMLPSPRIPLRSTLGDTLPPASRAENRDLHNHLARGLIILWLLVGLLLGCVPKINVSRQPLFAELIAQLSEEGGYFPSDNLISNESGYQKVLEKLHELNVRGGVYIGVGPEQNFTYIAQVRPVRAFILDIRRDNMLQHLVFKALFVMAHNRAEYLSLLFSRPLGRKSAGLEKATIGELVTMLDQLSSNQVRFQANLKKMCRLIEHRFHVPLTADDRSRVEFIYRSFHDAGLDLRYESHVRRSWRWFPTLREILLETDLSGRQRNFLASEDDFQFIKQLQERDLIIPVAGDFAGPKALRAIGDQVRRSGERVSVFYTSNVEFYLMQQDSFSAFVANVKTLPVDDRSLIVRSYLGFGYQHPEAVPGHLLTTLLQRVDRFIRVYETGDYRTYVDLGLLDYIRLRAAEEK